MTEQSVEFLKQPKAATQDSEFHELEAKFLSLELKMKELKLKSEKEGERFVEQENLIN